MTQSNALVIPEDRVLDPDAWQARTEGAFAALRERVVAELDEIRTARRKEFGDGRLRESEVAPLARALFGTHEQLSSVANGFKELAAFLESAMADEVGEVTDDIEKGRIVLGDVGTDIILGWARGSTTEIDHRNVDEALVTMYAKSLEVAGEPPEVIREMSAAYRQALVDANLYGKVEYGKTKLDALKRALQGTGDDDIAGLIEACMTPTQKDPKFSVKREEVKKRR